MNAMRISTTAGPGPCSTRNAKAVNGVRPLAPRVATISRPQRLAAVRAADEDDFEKRLKKMVKNTQVPRGDAKPEPPPEPTKDAAKAPPKKVTYDFADEKLYYEGPPHRGDLAVNVALGTTLVWLPLTLAAAGRAAFVKYRFTDRRFSVATNAPWKNEQIDVAYQEVKDVMTVPRGVGAWGDMVVTLRDESKVEIRSLDRFKELKEYILERRDALAPEYKAAQGAGAKVKGVVTAEELMGEEPAPASKGFGKN